MEFANKFYKNDDKKANLLKQLYIKNIDLTVLIRYYFRDTSKIDSILEKLRNPDLLREFKSVKMHGYMPIILDKEYAKRYSIYRESIIDKMFPYTTAFFGIIYFIISITISIIDEHIGEFGYLSKKAFETGKSSDSFETLQEYRGYFVYLCLLLIWMLMLALIPCMIFKYLSAKVKRSLNTFSYTAMWITAFIILTSSNEDDFYFIMLFYILQLFHISRSTRLSFLLYLLMIVCIILKVNFPSSTLTMYTMYITDERCCYYVETFLFLSIIFAGFSVLIWRVHYENHSRQTFLNRLNSSKNSFRGIQI